MFASPGAILVQLGPIAVRWYGLLIATGVLLGTTIAHREAMRRDQDPDQLMNAIVWMVMAGLVGARLYYVIFEWGDVYSKDLAEIFKVWHGGLAIHGGLLAGGITGILYCRHHGISIPITLDILAPGLAMGQAVGRWGNFFNEEAFGAPTNLPWKLYISPEHRPLHLRGFEYFHPTFLYESLWNLLVFGVLYFVLRKRLEVRPGALILCYFILYSIGRFFIEGLRIDSLMLGSLRVAQGMSALLALGSAAALAVLLTRQRPKKG